MKKYIKYLLMLCIIFTASAVYAVEFGDISTGNDVEIHGFLSQGYIVTSDNNFFGETEEGTSEFSEVGFNLGTDIGENLRVGMQVFSRKLGQFGRGDVEIDWAYADYRWKDWIGFRAGKMKMVHGIFNATRDIDFLRTSIFLPQSVYNEAWRDTVAAIQGGEIYGDAYLGKAGSLSYQFQGGNNEYPIDSGVATTTSDQTRLLGIEFTPEEYHAKYAFATGLAWTTPVEGLKFSLTGWLTKFSLKGSGKVLPGTDIGRLMSNLRIDEGGVEIQTRSAEYTTSIEYQKNDLTLIAEYSRNNYDFHSQGPLVEATKRASDAYPSPYKEGLLQAYNKSKGSELETEGYYGMINYRFTNWLEAGFYYSVYYADIDDKDGDSNKTSVRKSAGYQDHDAWLKDACVSLKFDISENWVFKLEGHAMNGAAILTKDLNSTETGIPVGIADILEIKKLDTEEDWYLGAAKLTFSF